MGTDFEVKVTQMESDIRYQSVIMDKMEKMMERLGEVSNSLSKIIAVHEEKLSQHQETHDELYAIVENNKIGIQVEVKELHSRITSVQSGLSNTISEVEKSLKLALKEGLNEIKTAITSERATVESDHEKRIRDLERWKWIMLGGAGVVGALARDAISYIFSK